MKKLLMILTVLISSCYTSNKANKDLNKAYENYPETVATFARDKFPCKETTIDSIIKTEYDFIEIKCPDTSSQVIDTLYLTKPIKPKSYIIYKDKFVAIPSTTKIITKYIKDSSCEILLNKSVMDAKLSKEKCDRKGDYINWLLIAFCLSFIANILFITTKK
jgi:hypothetical protein